METGNEKQIKYLRKADWGFNISRSFAIHSGHFYDTLLIHMHYWSSWQPFDINNVDII